MKRPFKWRVILESAQAIKQPARLTHSLSAFRAQFAFQSALETRSAPVRAISMRRRGAHAIEIMQTPACARNNKLNTFALKFLLSAARRREARANALSGRAGFV